MLYEYARINNYNAQTFKDKYQQMLYEYLEVQIMQKLC